MIIAYKQPSFYLFFLKQSLALLPNKIVHSVRVDSHLLNI